MPDKDKVIKGLEICTKDIPMSNAVHKSDFCKECPYYNVEYSYCWNQIVMMRDALALLKEQDAEWIYGEDETGVDGWHCSKCNFFEPWFYDFDNDIDFIKRYEHCPKCGRRMISYTGKQEGQ